MSFDEAEIVISCQPPIKCSISGAVATVALARPEKLNALNAQMRAELSELFTALGRREDVRAIAILGEGRAFCAGQDLGEREGASGSFLDRLAADLRGDFLDAVRNSVQPTVVGVQGYCLGRGLMLALECSIRVAAEDASFGYPEIELGMIPGAAGTQRLVETVGRPRALDMILSGRRIDAATALEWGLVTRTAPVTNLEQSVQEIARKLAARPASLTETAMKAVEVAAHVRTDDGIVLGKALSAVIAAGRREEPKNPDTGSRQPDLDKG